MLKPDIWLYPHNEGYNFEAKRTKSAQEAGKAWIDPEGYRKWVVAQREKFEATVNRELTDPASGELLPPSKRITRTSRQSAYFFFSSLNRSSRISVSRGI